MSTECNTCGNSYEKIAVHYAANESHRPELTEEQMDAVRFLLLSGASMDTNGSHHALVLYSTDVEFLKAAGARLESVLTSVRRHSTAAQEFDRLRRQYPDMDLDPNRIEDVYRLRTIPHPTFDRFEDGNDVQELSANVLTWFIESYGAYHGSAIIPTLYLDTRDTGVSADHLRRLLSNYGIQTGRLAENDSGRFFVPSHRDGVVSLPKKGIDQLRAEFDIDINPAEDERNHIIA